MTRKIRLDEFNDSMDNQLTINQDFAKKYEEKNRKEELSRRKRFCLSDYHSHGQVRQ
jgi:hypothetical protein